MGGGSSGKAGDLFVLGRGGEAPRWSRPAYIRDRPDRPRPWRRSAVAGIPDPPRRIWIRRGPGHAEDAYAPILEHPPHVATIIVLMGFAERTRVAEFLIARGWPADTPAAIVTNASQASERIWTGTLGIIGSALHEAESADAHTLVIGDVVAVGEVIAGGVSELTESRSSHGHERRPQDVRARAAVVCA